MMDDSVDQPPEIEPEDIICPHCGSGNKHDAEFCRACAAPLGLLATIDPLKRTMAWGWLSRRVVSGPHRLIVVLGIWLLIAPTAICLAVACITSDSIVEGIITGLISFCLLWGVFSVTREYIRIKRGESGTKPGGGDEDAGDSETAAEKNR